MNAIVAEKLKTLPDSPGVYKMLNGRGEIIYVGKAVSLKNRVRQYFHSAHSKELKVQAMVEHIEDFEYILTDSETEALTLESNLIKRLRPRYNILLKDDKHFPYVRIDTAKPYPRVEVVRRVNKDGAKYFGPYLSSIALQDALEAVREAFPARSCKKDISRAIARAERPCLMYHIGKCCAPCSGKITREEYSAIIARISAFLSGKTDDAIESLTRAMHEASNAMDFERAAMLRDRINAIVAIGEKQKAIAPDVSERDVFAFARQKQDTVIFALFMRDGKVVGAEKFFMLAPDDAPEAVMGAFIKQFYATAGFVPKEILLSDPPGESAALETWLGGLRGGKVTLTLPKRGDKKKLVDMARKNAADALEKTALTRERDWERHEGALSELGVLLGLDAAPERIEAFDNSNILGRDAVSAMIVFLNGRPASKEYRRFKVKTVEGADDYATMREAVLRRFKRMLTDSEQGHGGSFTQMPDLVLIDGGKGQLSAALEAMDEAGVSVPVAALAERLEEVYLPGESAPLIIERGSPALHLLQRVRDEAHRFAITYHRSLRQKNTLFSVLDEIPGVGPSRRKALFDAFASLDEIKRASLEQLENTKGMSKPSAAAVYAYFHERES